MECLVIKVRGEFNGEAAFEFLTSLDSEIRNGKDSQAKKFV